MDLQNLTLFRMADKRMAWIAQRQSMLASNIANVDTPDYLPSEIKPVSFNKELKKGLVELQRTNTMHMNENWVKTRQAQTAAGHLPSTIPSAGPNREFENKRPFETTIDENGVVLEEQLEKLSGNRSFHNVVTTIYKKNINMIGASLGRNLR